MSNTTHNKHNAPLNTDVPRTSSRRITSFAGEQSERKRDLESFWFRSIDRDGSHDKGMKPDKETSRRHRSSKDYSSSSRRPKSPTTYAPQPRRVSKSSILDHKTEKSTSRQSSTRDRKSISSGSKSRTSRRSTTPRYDTTDRFNDVEEESSLTSNTPPPSTIEVPAEHPRETSPSFLSVVTTTSTSTKRSNDSNVTLTQGTYDKHKANRTDLPRTNDSEVSEISEAVFEDSRSMEHDSHKEHQASVSDNTSVSDAEEEDAPSVSDAPSSSPVPASDFSSSEAPATPSSRSTVPSLTASRKPSSQSTHWLDVPLEARELSFDSQMPSVRSSSRVRHHDEQAAMGEHNKHFEQEREAHYAAWNEERYVRDLHAQEQAHYEHLARAQYPHCYADHAYETPEMGCSQLPPHVFYQRAIENRTMPSPLHDAHAAPRPGSRRATMPLAPEAPDLSKTTLVGYELLAAKLTEASPTIKPAYRKFEALQHRVLLHIQDEICELEERLRILEEVIVQTTSHEGGGSEPASRRMEVQQGNELHAERRHILGQIFYKMEQYYRTLSAYSGITANMDRASEGNVAQYRDWMTANRPVHHGEARFLHDSKDLITFPQRGSTGHSEHHSAVMLVFLPFLPLVTFSLVPTFSGRIFITAAMVAAGWFYVSGTDTRMCLSDKYWALGILIYLGLMTLVAAIVQ